MLERRRMVISNAARAVVAATLVMSLSACGDVAPGDASSEPLDGPLYAVSHSVYTPDGATSYLTLVDSLGRGPRVDLRKSLEFGGGARAYGPAETDTVYVTSSERGTITEVSYGPDGTPQIGRSVSFENFGVSATTGGNVHLFVAPKKAYFVSQETLEVVVWDPSAMAITTTISLELVEHLASPAGGYYFYPRPILVGSDLVLVANQYDAEDFDAGAVSIVVDTLEDRVVSTVFEARCHGMLQSAVDERGDRYFASSDYSAAQHFLLPERAPGPCMLRMRADETSFDAGFEGTLTGDLETRLWTGLAPGPDGRMYGQSIREEEDGVIAAAETLDAFGITIAEPWSWHSLTDGDSSPVAVATTFLRTPLGFTAIEVDGNAYGGLGGEVETTLVDLTSDETPERGLVVPGYVFNIIRIR
jgi:hypothetical protein